MQESPIFQSRTWKMVSLGKVLPFLDMEAGVGSGTCGPVSLFILIAVVVTAMVNLQLFLMCLEFGKRSWQPSRKQAANSYWLRKNYFPCCNERYITFPAAGGEKVKTNLERKGKCSSWLQTAGIQSLGSQKRGALFRGYRLVARAWTAGFNEAQTKGTYKGLLEGDSQMHRGQNLLKIKMNAGKGGWSKPFHWPLLFDKAARNQILSFGHFDWSLGLYIVYANSKAWVKLKSLNKKQAV